MTAPAEKTDIRPEPYVSGLVGFGIGHGSVADETDRLLFDQSDVAFFVQHLMGIDLCVVLLIVALKTDFPSVGIRTSPQEVGGFREIRPRMRIMTGNAFDLALKKWELLPRANIFGL
jgi:hypothetical protein